MFKTQKYKAEFVNYSKQVLKLYCNDNVELIRTLDSEVMSSCKGRYYRYLRYINSNGEYYFVSDYAFPWSKERKIFDAIAWAFEEKERETRELEFFKMLSE